MQLVARIAGLDPRDVSDHARQLGACHDMLTAGMDIVRVILAGDWERRPEMPAYYCKKLAPV